MSLVYMAINIYEEIFSNFMTAKITLTDTIDIEANLPIIGGELVNIQFTPDSVDEPISAQFYVYKIDRDLKPAGIESKRVKILYLCTFEGLLNDLKGISRKFSGKGHEIFNTVMRGNFQTEKEIFTHEADNEIEVFSNFWSPFKICNYLTKHSIDSDGNADFFAFESLAGFHFQSIKRLLAEDAVQELDVNGTDFFAQTSNANIRLMKFDTYFSLLEAQAKKGLGNTHYETGLEYGYKKHENVLETGFIAPPLRSVNNIVKHVYNQPDVKGRRNVYVPTMQDYNLTVKCGGTTLRQIGSVVTVDYPPIDRERMFHPKYTGNWLITGINHQILLNESYEQNLSLWKDEFFALGEQS